MAEHDQLCVVTFNLSTSMYGDQQEFQLARALYHLTGLFLYVLVKTEPLMRLLNQRC